MNHDYAPGEIWDKARGLLDKAKTEEDLKVIEALCEHMLLSDARLMLNKIEAKRRILFA